MRKWYVLPGALFMFAIVGCSDNPVDEWISKSVGILGNVTTDVETVNKTLGDAVTEAKRDNKPLDLAKIAKATSEAAGLKKKAASLQEFKAAFEVRKDSITEAQRKEYADSYKGRLQQKLQDLEVAQRNLDATMREAETVAAANAESKDALGKLRDAIREAQNEFEVLTKRQS